MDPLGTILGVWAHPDDETFLMAGLMAQAIRDGRRVVCVTATRGEEGSQDEERWPKAQLAEIRTLELERAMKTLGVDEHHWLDYPDGACTDVPFEDAVQRLSAIVAEVDPDDVLTFGPDGMTAHPDHIAVSGWTTESFRRSAKHGARLHHATITPEWLEAFLSGWEGIGAMMGEERPPVTPRDGLSIEFHIPPDLLDLKYEALRLQESQSASTIALLGEDFLRRDMAVEFYKLAETR